MAFSSPKDNVLMYVKYKDNSHFTMTASTVNIALAMFFHGVCGPTDLMASIGFFTKLDLDPDDSRAYDALKEKGLEHLLK